jgi:hypothetical protein
MLGDETRSSSRNSLEIISVINTVALHKQWQTEGHIVTQMVIYESDLQFYIDYKLH